MATSRAQGRSDTFEQHAVALAWGAWTELGVSGWTRTHGDWAVDPEPLVLFTAQLGDADPRLRDEATDWCIHQWRFISRSRLRNLLAQQPASVQTSFGEFAATVSAFAPVSWPGQTASRPHRPADRSVLPPLERPSLVWLRLRAMFGLAARTEVLRFFLSARARTTASVARLAYATGYTKRNVAEEADTLQRAGVLGVRPVANRLEYFLARQPELEMFVGDLPRVRPNWTALLNISRELADLEARVGPVESATAPVNARQALGRIDGDLRELEIDPHLQDVHGEDLWPAIRAFGSQRLAAWSRGDWPDAAGAFEHSARPKSRRPSK